MSMPKQSGGAETSLTRDAFDAVRYYLGGRRGLILLAVAAVGGGLALNWSWLVAAGIAPILLTALPCAAMCALGLCAGKMGGKSCASDSESSRANAEADGEPTRLIESAGARERPAQRIASRTSERAGSATETDQL